MKVSEIVVAGLAALSIGTASAAPTPYTLNAPANYTLAGIGSIAEFSFTLPSNGELFAGSFSVFTNHKFDLFFGTTLLTPDKALSFGSSFGGSNSYTFDSLIGGSYLARITNIGTTPGLGTFQANFTAAIPEPETYALAVAGLGVVGMVAARRRKV